MSNNGTPPFFQLGRRIMLQVWQGDHLDEMTGEVMDTDAGWMAIQADGSDTIHWVNMDYIVRIVVLGRVDHL
jgi:hypothetical protein